MASEPLIAGTVDWSGENPGMYLRESPDGPYVTLASFFRVVLSPHGRGIALLLLQSPQVEKPPAAAPNLCITDNEPLARWLVAEFASHFAAFKGQPGMRGLEFRKLTACVSGGDTRSTYTETLRGEGLDVRLTWEGLGEPFALVMPAGKTATGRHVMPSLFVGAERGIVTINGRVLPGKAMPREVAGRTITTAFLAFSETWIRV